MGRLGCDAPKILVKTMLELFEKVNSDEPVEYILLTGDIIMHKLALSPGEEDDPARYNLLKSIHAQAQELFTEFFPDIPVFLSFGNNDCKWHDNAAFQEEKNEFYSYMFDLWFSKHPANRKYADAARDTYVNGGYFRIDFDEQNSLLSLNTLMYNSDAVASEVGQEAEDQFNFLESALAEGEKTGRKFIITSHIYAGGRGKHDDSQTAQNLWKKEYNTRYMDLVMQYTD